MSLVAVEFGDHSYLGRLNSVIHFEHPDLFVHSTGFAALICLLRILEVRRTGEGWAWPWTGAGGVLVTALVLTQGRTTMVAFVAAAGLAIVIARDRRAAAALAMLLLFGVVCLLPDGHRLVSNPNLSSWLLFWLPVGWVIAAARRQAAEVTRPEAEGGASEVRGRTPPTGLF